MIYLEPATTRPFTVDGAPSGLAGQIGWTVEDDNDQVITARTVADTNEFAVGAYRHPVIAPDAEGSYVLIVDFPGGVPDVTIPFEVVYDLPDVPGIPGPDGYPTTEQLVALSNEPALTSLAEDAQDALRFAAITAVEEYTGQRFNAEVATELLDGNGTQVLALPRRLAAVTEVSSSGSVLTAGNVSIGNHGSALRLSNPGGVGWLRKAEADILGLTHPHFAVGYSNISVTGTWGWLPEEFPAAVRDALRIDMEEQALADDSEIGKTVKAWRKLGLRDARQGNLSLTLRPVAVVSDRVAAMLRSYMWTPAGAVA